MVMINVANTKLQRMARIRAYCTGEPYQKALTAVTAGGGTDILIRISDGIRSHDAWDHRQGGNGVLRTCPECDLDTFLDTSAEFLPKHLSPADQWFCFNCLFTASPSGIDQCLACGQPTTDTELSMCSTCMEWQMG